MTIREGDGVVDWLSKGTTILSVAGPAYTQEVMRALGDFSWETPDRTAARLFRASFDEPLLQQAGFALEWASGRVRDGRFTASLRLREQGVYQVLVSVPWRKIGLGRHSAPPDVVADDLLVELAKRPDKWNDVEWSPM